MIVVAIIGLLASIAIPAFQRYVMVSKEAGYPLVFSQIERGERAFYEKPRMSSTGTELEACVLDLPVPDGPNMNGGNSGPYVWSFNVAQERAHAEALSLDTGIVTALFPTVFTGLPGGLGRLCWEPSADSAPNLETDISTYSVTFFTDLDGDYNPTNIGGTAGIFWVRFIFDTEGTSWDFFWRKMNTTIY